MTDEKTKLIRSRGAIKGHVTKVEKEILGVLDTQIQDNTLIQLTALKNSYSDKLKRVKILDDKIADLLIEDEAAFTDEISSAMDFHEISYEIFAKIESYEQKALRGTNVKIEGAVPTRQSGETSSGSGVHLTGKTKLPKLELQKFSGDPLKWQEFWDQFKTSIHSNETISEVERFSYLKRYLDGSALSTVSGLTLTTANYEEAVKLLEERYGNTQVQITAHMESLLKIKRVRKMDDVSQLRKLYNDVENCVRNLKALGVVTSTYGSLLVPILNDRIPDELRVIISRKFGDSAWIQANERCVAFRHVNVDSGTEKQEQSQRRVFTTANLHVQENRDDSRKCVYCWKDHPSSKCRTVTNVDARIAILRKYARCFNCLKKDHVGRYCSSRYRCRKCNRRHHISLCGENVDVRFPERPAEEANTNSTNSTHVGTMDALFLHTAKARLLEVGGNNSVFARLLFDTASHHSYITEETAAKLRLKTLRKEWMTVNIFGKQEGELRELKVVQFRVQNKWDDRSVYVEAFCVPMVCNPLSKQDAKMAKERYEHLANLELADYSDGTDELKIDVLIGQNFYYSFMLNTVIKGANGPIALKSTLGWILGGGDASLSGKKTNASVTHTLYISSENFQKAEDRIREDLKRFWTVDAVGQKGEEDCVVHDFENHLSFDGEKYVTTLPFKPDHEDLPDNFAVCKSRL